MSYLLVLNRFKRKNKILLFIFAISLVYNETFAIAYCYSGNKQVTIYPDLFEADSNAVTPNDFSGSDVERIRAAIDAAKSSGKVVVIPRWNSAGNTNIWKVDSAILLPGGLTLILDNCILQLSDSSRDNLFRSDNIEIGDSVVTWDENIAIIGLGNPILRGADNPRATGDGHKTLVRKNEWGHFSYGSDAEKPGRKQTGDWRNVMVLIAYVKNLKIENVAVENSHSFAFSFERVINADISDIRFNLPPEQNVKEDKVIILNRDGIDLRRGCKNFKMDRISGYTQDDFIALSNFAFNAGEMNYKIGNLENTTLATSPEWQGRMDDIEDISISNITCRSQTRAVAIRATDSARIQQVYINNVVAKVGISTFLVGGKGYGKPSLPGRINNIYAMNVMGNGKELILIESAIENCIFMNGIYTGDQPSVIKYNINKTCTKNIKEINLAKITTEN